LLCLFNVPGNKEHGVDEENRTEDGTERQAPSHEAPPPPSGEAQEVKNATGKGAVSVSLFGGAKLGVEIGARVLISRTGQEGKRIPCEFAGASDNEFLIIKAPLVPGIKDLLREGDAVTIRYVHKGVLYGFRVHILNAVFKPAPLIITDYPNTAEKIELRDSKRVDCMLPCQIQTASNTLISAMVVDISLSGCRVACNLDSSGGCKTLAETAKGEALRLMLSLFSDSKPLTIPGRLKSMDAKDQSAYSGIVFEKLDENTRRTLTRFIQEADIYAQG
jgi:c-di-GMP-binding flagellar brake protein YcgR